MVLLIDNYDSFTYNLYQMAGSINPDIKVIRNDEMTVAQIIKLSLSHIILSPGPGNPKDSGICIEAIKKLYKSIPILGVCLGHQAIFAAFGGEISYADKLMHGKSSKALLDTGCRLFKDIPNTINVARYHSLACVRKTLPGELAITAQTKEGEIMAVSHKDYPAFGLQFHPESILTEYGNKIIKNFLEVELND